MCRRRRGDGGYIEATTGYKETYRIIEVQANVHTTAMLHGPCERFGTLGLETISALARVALSRVRNSGLFHKVVYFDICIG